MFGSTLILQDLFPPGLLLYEVGVKLKQALRRFEIQRFTSWHHCRCVSESLRNAVKMCPNNANVCCEVVMVDSGSVGDGVKCVSKGASCLAEIHTKASPAVI